jgi:predicted Zn-dependent protease
MKLEPPNTHYLNAAQGWLELGDVTEAGAELDQLAAELQKHPEVLEMRWQIYAKAHKWKRCIEVADELVAKAPKRSTGWIHRSYALHELKLTREAYEALLPAQTKFPRNWLIQYNLACYCCRLREFERAQVFLDRACKLGDADSIKVNVKEMALQDKDLKELWEHI